MKKLIIIFFLCIMPILAQTTIKIVMPGSGYSAQLRGKTGTRSAGETVQGYYSTSFHAHVFTITKDGAYDLYYNASGGSTYTKDTGWSGSYGKQIYAGTFADAIDTDGDNLIGSGSFESGAISSASIIQDSIITLAKFTTATKEYIGSGGNVTNFPDDVTIKDIAGALRVDTTNYIITHSMFLPVLNDTSELISYPNNVNGGQRAYLIKLSTLNYNGGGYFTKYSLSECEALIGVNTVDHITVFNHSDPNYRWVRDDYLDEKQYNVLWAGLYNDSTNANSNYTNIQRLLRRSDSTSSFIYFPKGKYLISNSVHYISLGINNIYGDGIGNTFLYATDTTNSFIQSLIDIIVPFQEKMISIRDLTLIGNYPKNKLPVDIGGSGGGAGLYISESTWDQGNAHHTVNLENIRVKHFKGEAIRISQTYKAILNNIQGDSLHFSFLNILAQHIVINDCYANRLWAGVENYSKPIIGLADQSTSMHISNFKISNAYKAGMTLYTADYIDINNANLTGNSADYGISINPKLSYNPNGVGSVFINNCSLDQFKYGLYLLSQSGIDGEIEEIKIEDNTITNSEYNGIYINFPNSTYSRDINIIDNTIYEFNTIDASGATLTGIIIYNADSLLISRNKIVNRNAINYDRGIPISLSNCDNFVISDNDFRGGVLEYIWLYTGASNYNIVNNLGLRRDRSIYDVDKGSWLYQDMFYENGGLWLGRFLFKGIGDQMKMIRYNTSGVVIDTLTVGH